MEKSKEFILDIVGSGRCYGLTVEELINANEIQFTEVLDMLSDEVKKCFMNDRFTFLMKNTSLDKQSNFDIIYNPDCEFDYFTMESCIADGTLYFGYDLMAKIVNKIINLETVNKTTIPEDLIEQWGSYDIRYTVGDFVFNNEYGDFGAEDKPWLHSRFTMMLPIKCEFIRK